MCRRFSSFFCENRPPGSRIIMAGVEKYETSLTIKRTFKENASCFGDSRFLKPESLVLEPLFCVDFSVCEADQSDCSPLVRCCARLQALKVVLEEFPTGERGVSPGAL